MRRRLRFTRQQAAEELYRAWHEGLAAGRSTPVNKDVPWRFQAFRAARTSHADFETWVEGERARGFQSGREERRREIAAEAQEAP